MYDSVHSLVRYYSSEIEWALERTLDFAFPKIIWSLPIAIVSAWIGARVLIRFGNRGTAGPSGNTKTCF
jgi:hypothetical protein